MIKNGTGKEGQASYFLTKNNTTINEMDLVAVEWNNVFVNVGPSLVKRLLRRALQMEC